MFANNSVQRSMEERRCTRIRRSSLLRFNMEDINPSIKIAKDKADLYQAFSLVHKEYADVGYLPRNEGFDLHYTIFSLLPHSRTFIFQDSHRTISTMTKTMDSSVFGLPMDALYHDELNRLRAQKRRIAEVSALATHSKTRWEYFFIYLAKVILRHAISARINDLCIMVNPKHVTFYKTIFLFEEFGQERFYETVNAPAVPLRLDVNRIRQKSRKAYANFDYQSDMYAFFYNDTSTAASIPQQPDPLSMHHCLPAETMEHFLELKPEILAGLNSEQQQFILSVYPNLQKLLEKVSD